MKDGEVLVLRLGPKEKKRYIAWDLVEVFSTYYKLSKSEVRRIIKQGGLVVIAPKETKWEYTNVLEE